MLKAILCYPKKNYVVAIYIKFDVMIVLPSNSLSLQFLFLFPLLLRRIYFYLLCACFCVPENVAYTSSAFWNLVRL